MTEPITLEQLKNASADAKTLDEFINGKESVQVVSRLGTSYPTLAEAVKNIRDVQIDNIGSYETVGSLPSSASSGDVAFVINDTTANNGLYRYSGQSWTKTSYANAFADSYSKMYWMSPAIVHNGDLHIGNRILLADNNGNTIVDIVGTPSQVFTGRYILPKSTSSSALYVVNRTSGTITTHLWGDNAWKNNPNLIPVAVSYFGSWTILIGEIIESKRADNRVYYDDTLMTLYPNMRLQGASALAKSLGISYEINSGDTAGSIFAGINLGGYEGKTILASIVVRDDTKSFTKLPAVFFRNASGAYQSVYMAQIESLVPTMRRYQCLATIPPDKPLVYVGIQTTHRVYLSALQIDVVGDRGYYFDNADIDKKVKFDINTLSAQAKNYSNKVKMYQPMEIEQSTHDYNVFVTYGQSLGRGNETWPSLSTVNKYGNLSLGTTAIAGSNDGNATDWVPRGNNNFNPLIAQTVKYGELKIYTQQETKSFPTVEQASGESPDVGMVNHAKFLHNFAKMQDDHERKFVAINACIGGKTIEQLSKDNTQDSYVRYNLIKDSLQRAKTAAQGKSIGVTAVVWAQGEYNYANYGGVTSRAPYLQKLRKLHSDMMADIKQATGQANDPLFITYQTSGQFTRDADAGGVQGLHIGMAQLDFVDSTQKTVLATPAYPFTDKGGHLSNNGSRWMGMQIAKVWHKVVERGEDWQPVRPVRIITNKNEIYVFYHVPEPPLVFAPVYVRSTQTMVKDYGFRVTDNADNVTINSVELVSDVCIKITVASTLSQDAMLWYASAATSGHGNVRDSDPSLGSDNYQYIDGMASEQNIPELIGKPYPLQNWCVAFCLPNNYNIGA